MRKYLIHIICEPEEIVSQANSKEQRRVQQSGVLFLVLHFLCFIGLFEAFKLMFSNAYGALVLAIPFTLIFMNLYRLNYITLPYNSSYKGFGNLLSISIRLGFVAVIAICISKPLEIIVFEGPAEDLLNNYKRELYDSRAGILTTEFNKQKNEIEKQIDSYKGNKELEAFIPIKELEIKKITEDLKRDKFDLKNSITKGQFFVKTLILLNRDYKPTHFVTFIVLIIAFVPILNRMIYLEGVGEKKKEKDKLLIQSDFEKMKEKYSILFEKAVGLKLNYKIRFLDPPYNNHPFPKLEPRVGTEEDFITSLKADAQKESC